MFNITVLLFTQALHLKYVCVFKRSSKAVYEECCLDCFLSFRVIHTNSLTLIGTPFRGNVVLSILFKNSSTC